METIAHVTALQMKIVPKMVTARSTPQAMKLLAKLMEMRLAIVAALIMTQASTLTALILLPIIVRTIAIALTTVQTMATPLTTIQMMVTPLTIPLNLSFKCAILPPLLTVGI